MEGRALLAAALLLTVPLAGCTDTDGDDASIPEPTNEVELVQWRNDADRPLQGALGTNWDGEIWYNLTMWTMTPRANGTTPDTSALCFDLGNGTAELAVRLDTTDGENLDLYTTQIPCGPDDDPTVSVWVAANETLYVKTENRA